CKAQVPRNTVCHGSTCEGLAAQMSDFGGGHGPGEATDTIEEEEVADPQAQHARADGRDGAPAGNETSDDEHGPASAGEHPLRRGEQTLPSGVVTPPVQPAAAAAPDAVGGDVPEQVPQRCRR